MSVREDARRASLAVIEGAFHPGLPPRTGKRRRQRPVGSTQALVARRILEAFGEANLAKAQRAVAAPKQRGRTGTVAGFNPSQHPRGAHGLFIASNSSPAQVKQFQQAYGLNPTGEIDAATRATMKAPPPQTLGQMAASEAAKKAQEEATKRKESRAKTEARRKEEGKPPVGSTSGSTSTELKRLKAEEKTAHNAGEQKKAEAIRAKITNAQAGSSTRSSTRSGTRSTGGSSSAATTRAAAKAEANALKAVKALGASAWQGKLALNQSLTPGTGMEQGKGPSPAVAVVQSKLQQFGFNLGQAGVDGKLGPATETAIKVLQREYSLPVTGTVESRTLQLLETLTERSVAMAKRGIIAAEWLPGEGVRGRVRAVVAALDAVV